METLNLRTEETEKIDPMDDALKEAPESVPNWAPGGYDKVVSPFAEKINGNTVATINYSFDNGGYENGCIVTIQALFKLLGVDRREFVPGSQDAQEYKKERERKDAIVIPALKEGEQFTEAKKIAVFETLAHDVWRAHQYDEARKGGPRAEIYKNSLRMPAIMEEDDAHQPVELEANAFARKARDIFLEKSVERAKEDWEKITDNNGEIIKNNRYG